MDQGRPMLLVVGASDTGRAPMAMALLRRALEPDVVVESAGVLAHQGERAAPEAQMALEQLGLDLGGHVSRALAEVDHARADLLLAVDRGTELVLFARFPRDRRIACLSVLADQPDVLDPHRMPLGIWVATAHQLEQQVQRALPELRARLGLSTPDTTTLPAAPAPIAPPLPAHTADAATETILAMLAAPAAPAAEPVQDTAAPGPACDAAVPVAAPEEQEMQRVEQVQRMLRLLAIAEEAPEIVDWLRLRDHLLTGLRGLATQTRDALDFTPAAALMIEGKLQQRAALPTADGLAALKRVIARLAQPVSGADLASLGQDLAQGA